MNIYIYSDESGVFDKYHNDYFVFGGLILIGKTEKDSAIRAYHKVEKDIKKTNEYPENSELKASVLSNKHKSSIFRSLNNVEKFAVIIEQKRIYDEIFQDKKSKQRYLDYAYKICIKSALSRLKLINKINEHKIENIYFFVDEHTTATNGKYELREALEQELKIGTFNYNYSCFFEPLFPEMKNVCLEYCNSKSKPLIRAADIIANNIYHKVISNKDIKCNNISIINLP